MKGFGLELRRTGGVLATKNLYKQVDAVLKERGIPSKGVNMDIQADTIGHALHKMIQPGKHFSVCTIDSCRKLAKVHISSERMQIYNAAHCVSWSEMTEEYRTSLMAMVFDDFRTVLNPEEISDNLSSI